MWIQLVKKIKNRFTPRFHLLTTLKKIITLCSRIYAINYSFRNVYINIHMYLKNKDINLKLFFCKGYNKKYLMECIFYYKKNLIVKYLYIICIYNRIGI